MFQLRHAKGSPRRNHLLLEQRRVLFMKHFTSCCKQQRLGTVNVKSILLNQHAQLTLYGSSTKGIASSSSLRHDTSWYGYDPLSSNSISFSMTASTGGVPSSSGIGFAPCRRRIMRTSGADACSATRSGDAFPHDSMGTSINLQLNNDKCSAVRDISLFLRNVAAINHEL